MKTRIEIVKFSIAGAIVNGTDFGVYYLLFHFVPFSVAKAISFTCAGLVGYLFNKYWTFKKQDPSFSESIRYILTNLLALGTNVLTNQIILNLFPHRVLWALIIATVVTGLLTFTCFKWWVFKKKR